MNTNIFLKVHASILFFLEKTQAHHHHNSINTNIMPTTAILNKEVLACTELHLDENVTTNLATAQNFHQVIINTITMTVLQY